MDIDFSGINAFRKFLKLLSSNFTEMIFTLFQTDLNNTFKLKIESI